VNPVARLWGIIGVLETLGRHRAMKDIERMRSVSLGLISVYITNKDEHTARELQEDVATLWELLVEDGVGKFLDEVKALSSPKRWSFARILGRNKDLTDPLEEFRLFSYAVEERWLKPND
jgi:hypothetical protein